MNTYFRYPVTPLGFDLLKVGDMEVGWAIQLERDEYSAVSWQAAILNRWQKAGLFKQFTKAHIKYVFNCLTPLGIHLFDGDHPRLWDWDYCPHPDGHCASCDLIMAVANSERVNRYGQTR